MRKKLLAALAPAALVALPLAAPAAMAQTGRPIRPSWRR
jgi:hypothetical protein